MKKLILFLAGCILSVTQAWASPLTVALPARAPLAKPFTLNIEGLPGDSVSVSYDGQHYELTDQGSGQFAMILGTTLDKKLIGKRQKVDITLHRAGKAYLIHRTVLIDAASYPEEHLKVAPKYVAPPKDQLKRIELQKKEVQQTFERANTLQQQAFTWPWKRSVPSEVITSVFGKRRVYNETPRSFHAGTDFRASTGTPVRAVADGIVLLTQPGYFSGNVVYLGHGAGLVTAYMHLSRIDVKQGDALRAGDQLGLAGATGRVTGPHLHLGVALNGKWIDPATLFSPSTLPIQTKTVYDLK